MWDRLWTSIIDALIAIFLPLIASYHILSGNLFLNVSAQDARGLEQLGNLLLTPTQYLLAGREARAQKDGSFIFVQRFNYADAFWPRTAACFAALPVSVVLGTAIKALGYIDPAARKRHQAMVDAVQSTRVHPQLEEYQKIGMNIASLNEPEWLVSQGFQRRAEDEAIMKDAKELLRQIGQILNEEKIPWWVDCGTLLGAYRYGGIIPWDCDIDIAIFAADVENVKRALNRLDPAQYVLQDWSGRDFPNSLFKVYLRKTNQWIDIYTYTIDEGKKEIACTFSLENNIFCLESWKIMERCYKRPVGFDIVFPLKKGLFDGVEVFVPRDTTRFLQRYYGEDLSPVKIYNPATGRFEKDLAHPYWKKQHIQ